MIKLYLIHKSEAHQIRKLFCEPLNDKIQSICTFRSSIMNLPTKDLWVSFLFVILYQGRYQDDKVDAL